MAKFEINNGAPGVAIRAVVEASDFKASGDMIVFYDANNLVVDAFRKDVVFRITRSESK